MITDPKTGEEYGTAAEIAAELGGDIKPATVRRWADLDRWSNPADALATHRVGRKVYYPFARAAEIERDKSDSPYGRRRRLDFALVMP